MVLSTEVRINKDGWKIKEIYSDGEFSHYALNQPMDSGHATNPFDEVKASGGLLKLVRNGETSVTFTGVIDGLNKYKDDADMPVEVFDELKEIGPY